MNSSVPTVVRCLLFSLSILLLQHAPAAAPLDVTPGQGTMQLTNAAGDRVSMPLRHTDVRVEVTGFVARVEVIQTFGNPFDSPIEATYVFPLPERAAVDDFLLEVRKRHVRGEIRRREEARAAFESARAAGYTASLLDQQRPNIFLQSVTNIPPGEDVRIHLRYIDILHFADGAYRFLYPMVVGPRYTPTRIGQPGGAAGDTVSFLRPGSRPGNDIAVTIDIDSGVPIRALTSTSHKVNVTTLGVHRARVTLAPDDAIPNKDLMVQWQVAGEMPEIGLLAHRTHDEGFFALLIQPKAEVAADEAAPKEIIFVLDQSGSMSGLPIEMSKKFMRLALQSLGARDRFNIVRFDGAATVLAPEPLDNTQANVRLGLEAVESMEGSGGTEMLAGFESALTQPRDPRCIRIIFFLTDGLIGNEEEIFELLRKRRGDARIFALGVGTAVNHHLLRGMSDIGHGAYQYIRPDGREATAVEQFQRWVTKPYLTDLEIDWGGLRVEDVQPSRLPDLYSGQTLSLVGRYLWGGSDTLIIRGRLGGVPWEKQVGLTLPEHAEDHAALASVWARHRIQDLLMEVGASAGPEIEAQVTSLALAFRLMSPFTSFVAVDESVVVNPDGNPLLVRQRLPLPELASFEGCFGANGPGRAEPLVIPLQAGNGGAVGGPAAIGGVVRDSQGIAIPGILVHIDSGHQGVSRQTISDLEGAYSQESLPAGDDYFLRINHAGFASIEIGPLTLSARVSTVLDITLRSEEETTETIIVESKGRLLDTEYGASASDGLPIIGHNYQDVLSTAPGATDNDDNTVHGARDTGLDYRLDGANAVDPITGTFGQNLVGDSIEDLEVVTSGAAAEYGKAQGGFGGVSPHLGSIPPPPPRPRKQSPRSIEEAALRVLADLADDGRLSRSEGMPALAGLLGAQYSDGGFSASIRVQSLATWALTTAAASEPGLRWLPEAARDAALFLMRMRSPCDSMEPAYRDLADGIIGMAPVSALQGGALTIGRCVDARPLLELVRHDLDASRERLVDRILGR